MKIQRLISTIALITCLTTESLPALNFDIGFEKLDYIDNDSLNLIYGSLSESMIDCKMLAQTVAKRKQITIVDLGCAVGDFLNSFNLVNKAIPPVLKYKAIGVDPLIEQYKYRKNLNNYIDLYNSTYEAVISDSDGNTEIYVNSVFLDLTSIKNIDQEVFHNLPSRYDPLKPSVNDAFITKVNCESLTFNTLCKIEHLKGIDILKIDTQGNEYEILNSIEKDLLENISIIYVETSTPNKKVLYKNQENFQAISQLLFKNNFTLVGAYGLDDFITLEESIDINCIFLNCSALKKTKKLLVNYLERKPLIKAETTDSTLSSW